MLLKIIFREIEAQRSRPGICNAIGTMLFSREFQVICLYRISHHFRNSGLRRLILQPLKWWSGVISGCEISPHAVIGAGFHLPHPTGVVVGEGVIIGENVTLYQGVTLGRREDEPEYPTLEDNVRVYANVSILGAVNIGHGSVVGAHALVLKSFPPMSRIVGVPAKSLIG